MGSIIILLWCRCQLCFAKNIDHHHRIKNQRNTKRTSNSIRKRKPTGRQDRKSTNGNYGVPKKGYVRVPRLYGMRTVAECTSKEKVFLFELGEFREEERNYCGRAAWRMNNIVIRINRAHGTGP